MTTYDQRGQHVETQYNVAGDLFVDKVEVVLPAPADRRNLAILRDKVKRFWIEGVLEKSIHAEVMLEHFAAMDDETEAQAKAESNA